MAKKKFTTVVAGDLVVDWFEVTSGSRKSRLAAKTDTCNWKTYPQTRQWIKPGGALLLADFLRNISEHEVISYKLNNMQHIPSSRIIRSYAKLAPFKYNYKPKNKNRFVRLNVLLPE